MTPEQQARLTIDGQLAASGWVVQDYKRLNLRAGRGVAVREFPLLAGPTDYLLFVDGKAVGVVEAKKVGTALTGVELQVEKYREGVPEHLKAPRLPLPFGYESTGVETRFTSGLDFLERSRAVFAFHRPEQLAAWLDEAPAGGENRTFRNLVHGLPPLTGVGLRDCQFEAITNLERSLAADRPRALIQMATGSGKTYTAIGAVYRLLKHGGARRVLFLVDRANLGRQALAEFQTFVTPDDGRKFTEIYNVQHLQSNVLNKTAAVCITTIQRLFSILAGQPELDPALDETSLFELDGGGDYVREVRYNPVVPIEFFDALIVDECHRSIYNLWRGVLEYFDAALIGLTATPNKQTFGFFNQNLVMEYGHQRAVAEAVNVDYSTYRIKTAIGEGGGLLEAGEWVDRRDRQTRAKRWEELDEELAFGAKDLNRAVVVPDQLRTVLRAVRDGLRICFPERQEVPKTLIFALDDAHADDVVQMVREVFDAGNEFARKITYKTTGQKPEELIKAFRTSYYPRVAVTVDMIATGTDIRPLEALVFLRSVKSKGFFEQMKGRGTRVISDSDLQSVSPSATSKTGFVLFDAVGVTERIKTDEPPLERQKSVPFGKLLMNVALGDHRPDTLSTLAGRLGRLAGRVKPADALGIIEATGGRDLRALANDLLAALDPDRRLAVARADTGEAEPDDAALDAAYATLAGAAAMPFSNPTVRDAIEAAQRRDEQTIAVDLQDRLLGVGHDRDADARAREAVGSFRQFILDHRDEIAALQVLYAPGHGRLKWRDLKALAQTIAAPPLGLTTDRLWRAYATLEGARVRGAGGRRLATDLVALVRFALERERGEDATLTPWPEIVAGRFAAWLDEQERRRGEPFTAEQVAWLGLIRDQIATSLSMEKNDFDYDPFVGHGGLGRAHQLFGAELPTILQELNERLAA